jgi:hypothetical protein
VVVGTALLQPGHPNVVVGTALLQPGHPNVVVGTALLLYEQRGHHHTAESAARAETGRATTGSPGLAGPVAGFRPIRPAVG